MEQKLNRDNLIRLLKEMDYEPYTPREGSDSEVAVDIDIQTACVQVIFQKDTDNWKLGVKLNGYITGSNELKYLVGKVERLENMLILNK